MNALEVWQRVVMRWGGRGRQRPVSESNISEVSEGSHLSVTLSAYHRGQGSRSVRQPGDISPTKVFKNQQETF